jgi:hypothetical protein
MKKSKTKQKAILKRGAKRKNREKASLKNKYVRREEFLSKKNEDIRKQEDEIRRILESRPTY